MRFYVNLVQKRTFFVFFSIKNLVVSFILCNFARFL